MGWEGEGGVVLGERMYVGPAISNMHVINDSEQCDMS